jgi:hypothetical protein
LSRPSLAAAVAASGDARLKAGHDESGISPFGISLAQLDWECIVSDDSPIVKAAYFRDVAARLRSIADELRFNPRRRNQLLALAEGFERHAKRFEREDIG